MPNPTPGPNQDVLPSSDADLLAFAAAFQAAWNPATFNATAPLAGDITDSYDLYQERLNEATNTNTRTRTSIARKNEQKALLSSVLRDAIRLAVAAYRAGTASATNLTTLGIRIPDTTKTQIPAPQYAPLLALSNIQQNQHRLRLQQVTSEGPVSTRKFAYGLVGAQIMMAATIGGAKQVAAFRKSVNITVDTTSMMNGSTVYYWARYMNARGEFGPLSEPIAVVVQSDPEA